MTLENPSKEYEKLMKKISRLEFFKQKNEAISILSSKLNKNRFTVFQQSSGLIRLGLLYVSLKNYLIASELFGKALRLVKDYPFPYHPNFKIIFETFKQAKKCSFLDYWSRDFSNRVGYDKRYNKLNEIYTI